MEVKKFLSKTLYRLADHAATRYVAGDRLEDAVRAASAAAERGWSSIICPWDMSSHRPHQVLGWYQQALAEIIARRLDTYLSVKFTSLALNLDLLRPLVEEAAPHGVRIHFDAMWPDAQQLTLDAVKTLAERFENIGVTLPTRWQRTAKDIALLSDLRVPVRIVKGMWADPVRDTPDTVESFVTVVRALLPYSAAVEIATHSPAVAEAAFAEARGAGHVELSQLFGLSMRTAAIASAHDIPVRLYIPYRSRSLPYDVSLIRREPKIAWRLAYDLLRVQGRALT